MIQLEDKLYTSTEVAEILGVSLRSVYRYLEENKLDAEVKTATGRHRFSKKNIIDFLYPQGVAKEEIARETPKSATTEESKKKTAKAKPSKVKEVEETEVDVEEETPIEEAPQEVEEEPIDWLAKFREAAKKYREEADTQDETPAEPVVESTMSMADSVSHRKAPVREEPKATGRRNFYRSSLGGLKDIAQSIDKGSRNSYLDYAFTLNAGLSLYKPIKPFSMLHAYIKPGDLPFYEKLLGLTPADESNAQLCLLVSEEDTIYKTKDEMHGLFVVSKDRLYVDIKNFGDSTLTSEASGILG